MKQGKCGECSWQNRESTSDKMETNQTNHWKDTGHRRFIGIKGWGSRTYPKLMRKIEVPEGSKEMPVNNPPTIKPGPTLEEVKSLIEKELIWVRGVPMSISEMREGFIEQEEYLLKLEHRIERLEGLLRGFGHNIVSGDKEVDEPEEDPEPVEEQFCQECAKKVHEGPCENVVVIPAAEPQKITSLTVHQLFGDSIAEKGVKDPTLTSLRRPKTPSHKGFLLIQSNRELSGQLSKNSLV